MKQVGKILKELGFREEAPMSTQQALFKHLARAAEELKAHTLVQEPKPDLSAKPQQLSFDFNSTDESPKKTNRSA